MSNLPFKPLPIPQLVQEYTHGGEKLARAIRGLAPEDLLQTPPPDSGPEVGKWSIHELVLHLADAEGAFADRIKRLIAEDEPTLLEWNENRFAEKLMYTEQSAQDAVTIVDLTRKQLGKVLQKLPESAFERAGNHSSRGRQTLAEVIGYDVWHLEHHLPFITAKRELFGTIMW